MQVPHDWAIALAVAGIFYLVCTGLDHLSRAIDTFDSWFKYRNKIPRGDDDDDEEDAEKRKKG